MPLSLKKWLRKIFHFYKNANTKHKLRYYDVIRFTLGNSKTVSVKPVYNKFRVRSCLRARSR